MLDAPNCDGSGKDAALRIGPTGTIGFTRLAARSSDRAQVCGEFLCAGGDKLDLRGVTYGTFRLGERGEEFRAGGCSRVRLRDDAGRAGSTPCARTRRLKPPSGTGSASSSSSPPSLA